MTHSLLLHTPALLLTQMAQQIQQWQTAADDKALFLRCYMMMTSNMLQAIEQQQFHDPVWVNALLHRFAHYYFIALQAYETQPQTSPQVWQMAHNAARDPRVSAIQKMLLGVSAHINYDLVLALVDMLQPEWAQLSVEARNGRYADHCRVNEIIGRTIDAVQDEVLEPAMPLMDVVDKLMGPFDELLLSRLIARWRETVWRNAARLLATTEPQARAELLRQIEETAVATGKFICNRY
ncbi:MAG: hypothetical protein H6658_09410 [Ardenticatenaceae bacterium]|nr:hypothetical protein [Ardenticatenaceae bacterium]